MIRKQRTERDPIESEIEYALDPGCFIRYQACPSFVRQLERVEEKIAALTSQDPQRAVALYETFLAGCDLKIEELDDSGGDLGMFVEDLYCGWIKARQAQRADPDETALRLLTWIDEDEYGFTYRLERSAPKAFDKANLAAFAKHVRKRFDTAREPRSPESGRSWETPKYLRHHWGQVLRKLYAAQKDVVAYQELAEDTGLTDEDCHQIAKLLVSKRKPEDALSWVERGFEIGTQSSHGTATYYLGRLKRDLLIKLGRSDEALDAAWREFEKYPGLHTYEDLMKDVSEDQRETWHERAIDLAMKADLRSVMDLLLETKELERLAHLVRKAKDENLEDLSHNVTKPVAKKFEKPYPDLAARLWCAQGFRILKAKKSKYYQSALADFECAERSFDRAGLQHEWEKLVQQIRRDHRRKSNFMPGFERLVEGIGPSREPSFLDRAKAKWSTKEQKSE